MSSTEAKPRQIKLEAHVLAYLGDFMNIFEESIRRKALREIHTMPEQPKPPTTGNQKPREPLPSSR
jgi:23S rRNA maturation mini-RNase III